jgi:hypothetical protein
MSEKVRRSENNLLFDFGKNAQRRRVLMSGMQKKSCDESEKVKADRSLTEVAVDDVRKCKDLMKISEDKP